MKVFAHFNTMDRRGVMLWKVLCTFQSKQSKKKNTWPFFGRKKKNLFFRFLPYLIKLLRKQVFFSTFYSLKAKKKKCHCFQVYELKHYLHLMESHNVILFKYVTNYEIFSFSHFFFNFVMQLDCSTTKVGCSSLL